jgi:hypothetical protein
VSGKFKRPTHESDAMKIFMSDSVAPEFLPLLQKYGDFAAAAIAYSAQRSPDFWNSLLIYTRYCAAMKEFFERLHREGQPVRREWLKRIKAFASKYDDNVAARRARSTPATSSLCSRSWKSNSAPNLAFFSELQLNTVAAL